MFKSVYHESLCKSGIYLDAERGQEQGMTTDGTYRRPQPKPGRQIVVESEPPPWTVLKVLLRTRKNSLLH